MQKFIIALLICSATMSILALLYMVLTPFLTMRYSEKGRYYTWLVIVIGFIIPFRPNWASAAFTVDIPVTSSGDYFVRTVTQTWSDNIATLPTFMADVSTAPIVATFNITLWHSIGLAWLIGMVAFVVYQISRHYRFVKTARRWWEAITDERALSILHELKMEMGIKRQVSLFFSPCISSPMMIGLIKPQILLPTGEFAEDELRFILKHELVHYKRNDMLYKFLVFVATAIHWFNPVVYLVARAANVLCETSCDAEVVRNTNEDTRQQYSETIIGVVKYRSKTKLSTAFSTNFYGGKKGMKNRISSIMDMSKKKTGVFILCSVLILTLGTGVIVAANESSTAKQVTTAPVVTAPSTRATDTTDIIVELSEYIAELSELTINEPLDFIEIESGEAIVIAIPERNANIEVTYLLLFLEGSPEMPAMPLEHAVQIGANAIYNEFGFCIDGLAGRMLFIDGVDGIQRWVGNIFSSELTTHSDSDELFHFTLNAETGKILTLYMNTEATPFMG